MHNRFTEEFVAMDTKWYQLRYHKSSCFIALKAKSSVVYRATLRQHGNVIADFSGLDRRLVNSFDYMYFNRIKANQIVEF